LVRSCLRSVLAQVGLHGISEQEVLTAFDAVRALEHRLRLYGNTASLRITPAGFKKWVPWGYGRSKNRIDPWRTGKTCFGCAESVRKALEHFCPSLH